MCVTLDVRIEKRQQELVGSRLVGLGVEFVDQAELWAALVHEQRLPAVAKLSLAAARQVQLDETDVARMRRGDLLHEERVPAARCSPDQVVLALLAPGLEPGQDALPGVPEVVANRGGVARVATDDAELRQVDRAELGEQGSCETCVLVAYCVGARSAGGGRRSRRLCPVGGGEPILQRWC